MEGRGIKVKLDGKRVADGSIDSRALGWFLLNIQTLLDKLAIKDTVKRTKVVKETVRLYLKEINKGSVELVFQEGPQTTLDEANLMNAGYAKLLDFTRAVATDTRKARELMVKDLPNPISRLRVETSLRSIRDDGLDVTFYDQIGAQPLPLRKDRLGVVDDWIREDEKIGTTEIRGAIVRLKADEPKRYFSIVDEKGKILKCRYQPEFESRILDLFKSPVKISGVVQHKPKVSEISELIDISAWTTTSFDKVGIHRLHSSLACTIEIEDDVWFLSNGELSIHGAGFTFEEARKDFEEDLGFAVEFYLRKKGESDLSPDARALRQKIQRYIG